MNNSLTQTNFITSIRYLITTISAWAVGKGYIRPDDATMILGVALILGPPMWAFLDNYLKQHQSIAREAAAVQAGIELVANDKALAADGTTIVTAKQGTTPPRTVTIATAQEIIKDYAPPAASIAKA